MFTDINIYMVGVFGSIFVYLLVGIYAGRKVKNIEDYYVSGRNATTIFITGTMFASMLSTNGFMGDTAYAYCGNITTIVLINSLCACGYILGPLFFGRYIRRAESTTMPSYFGSRFNSLRIRRFAGIITIISLSAYFLSVMQGTGILMETLTELDRGTCLFISWACIMLFTLYSGSRGVIVTDTVMCILFLGATIIAGPYIFDAAGGIGDLVVNLVKNPNTPESLLSYHGNTGGETILNTVMYGVTMGIVWMITVSVSPWQAGRNLMAKNEHVIFRSGAISAFLTVAFLIYLYLMAISVITLNPNMGQPEKVIIWAAYEVMPKMIGMLLLIGIMAAGLSSASTFLSVVSFSLSNDVLNLNFKNEQSHLAFSRVVLLGVGVLSLILAYLNLSSMRIIAWFASTIIAASWGYLAFSSVWCKKITERGAYYAMVGGFFGYLLSECLKEFVGLSLENFFHPFFIGVFISILGAILGSSGECRTQEEIDFHEKLHVIPQNEKSSSDYKIDKAFGWFLIIAGIAVSTLLIKYWALPYNGAIGNDVLAIFG